MFLFFCLLIFTIFGEKISKKFEMYVWTLCFWLESLILKLIEVDNMHLDLVRFYWVLSWILFIAGSVFLWVAIFIPYWSNKKSVEVLFNGDKNEV